MWSWASWSCSGAGRASRPILPAVRTTFTRPPPLMVVSSRMTSALSLAHPFAKHFLLPGEYQYSVPGVGAHTAELAAGVGQLGAERHRRVVGIVQPALRK